ncbi:MAG: M48 family metallopeptidase [Chitinophagaceae bacterium]|nr:M48 family metallopeptidase [Chitinophagaceae bacterium]
MQPRKIPIRLIIMLGFVLFSVASYYMKSQVNPVTGEKQRVDLSPEQEVAMGLQSAPSMAAEFGGLYPDENVQLKIRAIGMRIVNSSQAAKSPYQFNFHVLADENVINAFALPGGQIFITAALLKRLDSEDQVAAVLGHEIGHVINRHSAEQMAKQGLMNGIVQGVAMGSDMSGAQVANYVGQMMNLKYGRDDELEADDYGVRYTNDAGYNPRAAIRVQQILAEASGGKQRDEMNSTHPSSESRIQKIEAALKKLGK